MRRLIGFAVLAGALAVVVQHEAPAQTKPATKQGTTIVATPAHYAMLRNYREIVGTVESVDKGSVVMKISYDHPLVTQTASRTTSRTRPAQPQVKVTVIHDMIKFDLPFTENASFRKMAAGGLSGAGVQYDSKGDLIAPGKTPAATTKATDNLPGFPAAMTDIGPGDTVKAVMAAPLAASGNNHPRVKTLILLKDSPGPANTKKAAK